MLLELIRKCSVSNVATFPFILCGTDLNYSRLMSNHKPLISQFFVFVSYLSIFSWRLYGFHGCLAVKSLSTRVTILLFLSIHSLSNHHTAFLHFHAIDIILLLSFISFFLYSLRSFENFKAIINSTF